MATHPPQPSAPVGDGLFDGVLLDLDGCVYAGTQAIAGATEAIEGLRRAGVPVGFLTNNASRSPEEAAAHIRSFGVPAGPEEVMTSAVVAAQALAREFPAGTRVLVTGAQALVHAVEAAGLTPVSLAAENPEAVVQGFSRATDWDALAETCAAIRAGAQWWATNLDSSIPTERGPMPANGAFVSMVATVVGAEPRVAGKPAAAMMEAGARMLGVRTPLMVGDRLDTDIAGGRAAGFPSALVLTGVDTESAARRAPTHMRPDFVLDSLTALLHENRASGLRRVS